MILSTSRDGVQSRRAGGSGGAPLAGELEYKALTNQLYRDFLGRDADRSGLRTWPEQLRAGDIDAERLAVVLQNTAEAITAALAPLFRIVFGRELDDVSRLLWVRQIQHGWSYTDVVCELLSSDECWLAHQGHPDRWAAATYRALLHREADPDGLATWTHRLSTISWSRRSVAEAIAHSPEYERALVDRSFRRVLGRVADPVEAEAATALFRGAGSFAMAASLTNSSEYFERAMQLSLPRTLARSRAARVRTDWSEGRPTWLR